MNSPNLRLLGIRAGVGSTIRSSTWESSLQNLAIDRAAKAHETYGGMMTGVGEEGGVDGVCFIAHAQSASTPIPGFEEKIDVLPETEETFLPARSQLQSELVPRDHGLSFRRLCAGAGAICSNIEKQPENIKFLHRRSYLCLSQSKQRLHHPYHGTENAGNQRCHTKRTWRPTARRWPAVRCVPASARHTHTHPSSSKV